MATSLEDVVELVWPDLFEYNFLDQDDLCDSSSARSDSKSLIFALRTARHSIAALFVIVYSLCVVCSVSTTSNLINRSVTFS